MARDPVVSQYGRPPAVSVEGYRNYPSNSSGHQRLEEERLEARGALRLSNLSLPLASLPLASLPLASLPLFFV